MGAPAALLPSPVLSDPLSILRPVLPAIAWALNTIEASDGMRCRPKLESPKVLHKAAAVCPESGRLARLAAQQSEHQSVCGMQHPYCRSVPRAGKRMHGPRPRDHDDAVYNFAMVCFMRASDEQRLPNNLTLAPYYAQYAIESFNGNVFTWVLELSVAMTSAARGPWIPTRHDLTVHYEELHEAS